MTHGARGDQTVVLLLYRMKLGYLPSLGQLSILTFASRTGTSGTIMGADAGNGIRLDPDPVW